MKFSQRMLKAYDRTIKAYKALIKAPRKEAPKWNEYGNYDSCRLCRACDNDCRKCILSTTPLGFGCINGALETTNDRLTTLVNDVASCDHNAKEIRKVASKRLKQLQERAKKNLKRNGHE